MTALENVELPTDALPVDAVLRRAAASVYTLTIARALANSPGLLLLDEPTSDLVAYTSWYVFVRDVMVASEKRMKEEDIRNTLLMKKALAVLSLQQTPSTSSKPQFISQTCISAVLLNSSPLTDLASIVAEVDANEVFMLHKTNMLEEIGAENELMERSCAGMMDWIGMGGLPDVDEEEEERRKETEAKEEEERLREERKEQELNKVAEETNEQEKRAKEAQPPTSDEHPSHIPLHYRLCRRPSSIIPLSPPHGPSPPYPLHILPRPIQLVLVSLPPHLNQLPRSISAGTKRNLKAMEEGDAQSSVATGQSEVAVSVEQAKKAREELEK
ncbi:hypothetical protein BLNAU_11358 [Blattamonas nauphoetae]|uniref:Uncharacterized protein n=1 Tax=Blattamonas nauphoetae TaxID=2049346 RepID=A0ABQ9XS15_9EUKA|nr:hypothetical protein BLNAU_11358 [Blattamonas nauphoetae]